MYKHNISIYTEKLKNKSSPELTKTIKGSIKTAERAIGKLLKEFSDVGDPKPEDE